MAKQHQTKTGQANAVPADRAIVACRKACHETMEQYRGIASSSRTWKNCSATFLRSSRCRATSTKTFRRSPAADRCGRRRQIDLPRHCAGTEQYLTRFLHELIWLISPTNEQRTAVLKSESVKTKSNLCPADYLRPHHGAGGFRAAAQIPA